MTFNNSVITPVGVITEKKEKVKKKKKGGGGCNIKKSDQKNRTGEGVSLSGGVEGKNSFRLWLADQPSLLGDFFAVEKDYSVFEGDTADHTGRGYRVVADVSDLVQGDG